MELLLIFSRSSIILIFPENGSEPKINGSLILPFLFEITPLLGSILTKLIPDGILNGVLFSFIFIFLAKFLKIELLHLI